MSHYLSQARKATRRVQTGNLDPNAVVEALDYVVSMIDSELTLTDGDPDVSITHALRAAWLKLDKRATGLMDWFAQQRRELGERHDPGRQKKVLYMRQKNIYKYGTIYFTWEIYSFTPVVGKTRSAETPMFSGKALRANKTGTPYTVAKLLRHSHDWDNEFVLQAETEARRIREYTRLIARAIKDIKKIEVAIINTLGERASKPKSKV